MKILKKSLLLGLQLLSINIVMFAGSYRLPNYSSHTSNLATYEGQGRFHKTVQFNDDVTISNAHALTLATTDALVVHAKTTDQISITAASTITGITDAKFPTLTTTATTGTNVTITGTTIINGNLTIGTGTGGELVVDGDLIVKGAVTVAANAILTVKGDIIFDGDDTNAVIINGTVNVNGLGTASKTKQGDMIVRNTTGVTFASAGSITATGFVRFETNSGATSITVAGTVTAEDDVTFFGNTNTTADSLFISGTVTSNRGCVHFIENLSTATAFAVYISTTGTVTAHKDVTFIESAGGGAADGARIESGASVRAARNVIIKKGSSGDKFSIAPGGILNAAGAVVFDDALTVSTGLSGNILGNVIVHGDLTVDANLEVTGDLTVKGGAVDIQSGFKLTAHGDILFDGQQLDKTVTVTGNIVGLTTSDPGVQNLIIKDYVATTSTNVAVTIAGIIVASSDVQFISNIGADGADNASGAGVAGAIAVNVTGNVIAKGNIKLNNNSGGAGGDALTASGTTGGAGGDAVFVSGALTAAESITVINNTGGAAGTSFEGAGSVGGRAVYVEDNLTASDIFLKDNTGGAGGNGVTQGTTIVAGGTGGVAVQIHTGSATLAHASMVLSGNIGGAGGTGAVAMTGTGDLTGGTGGAGADGIFLSGSSTIMVDSVFTVRSNTGGAGGIGGAGGPTDGDGGTGGAGGDGFNLASTVTVNGNKVTTGNAGGAGGTGGVLAGAGSNGAAGAAGSATNITGTCTLVGGVGKYVYDGDVTTSAIAAAVSNPLRGDVCVTGALTVDSDFTVYGTLTVNGNVTTDNTTHTLTVYGDVIFDSQGQDEKVVISANDTLNVCNIVIKNYAATATTANDHAVTIAGTLTATRDIMLKSNNTSVTDKSGVSLTGTVTAGGDVTFDSNSSTGSVSAGSANGVNMTGSITARCGTVLFKGNTSSNDNAVDVTSDNKIEALNINFCQNVSSATGMFYGVKIATTNTGSDFDLTAQNDLRFVYNQGGTSGKGVLINGVDASDQVNILAASMYVVVDCTASAKQDFEIGSEVTKEDFYGATLMEFISNTGTLCMVDITP